MRHCFLCNNETLYNNYVICRRSFAPAKAQFDFPKYENWLDDPRENKNCTMVIVVLNMLYGELFYRHYKGLSGYFGMRLLIANDFGFKE